MKLLSFGYLGNTDFIACQISLAKLLPKFLSVVLRRPISLRSNAIMIEMLSGWQL